MGPGEIAFIVILAVGLTIIASRDRKSVRQAAAIRQARQAARPSNKKYLVIIAALTGLVAILLLALYRSHSGNSN